MLNTRKVDQRLAVILGCVVKKCVYGEFELEMLSAIR